MLRTRKHLKAREAAAWARCVNMKRLRSSTVFQSVYCAPAPGLCGAFAKARARPLLTRELRMAEPRPRVTSAHIDQERIPGWRLWVNAKQRPEYDVVIPSHARAADLCGTTLTLLRKHSVDMSRVHVFVDYEARTTSGERAYDTYVRALRARGFAAVHVRPGGKGLEGNMQAIRTLFDVGTYLITMSDKVTDVLEVTTNGSKADVLKPIPVGSLPSLWHHGHEVLRAGGFAAWSTNATHSARTMKRDVMSRKAGLLDGNMTGQLVTADFRALQIDHGLVYDVEYAAALWHSGHRYVRYRGICCKHPYRSSGGQSVAFPDPSVRRQTEDDAIRAVAAKYPDVVQFSPKPDASLRVMQYSFRSRGPCPLTFQSRNDHGAGRRRRYQLDRLATDQKRQVAWRKNHQKTRDQR